MNAIKRALAIAIAVNVVGAIAPVPPVANFNPYQLIRMSNVSREVAISMCQAAARRQNLRVGWMEFKPDRNLWLCYLRPKPGVRYG